jgi:hypothetical protein
LLSARLGTLALLTESMSDQFHDVVHIRRFGVRGHIVSEPSKNRTLMEVNASDGVHRLVVFPNVIIGLVSPFLSTTAGRVSVVFIRALICRLCSIGVLLTLPLRGRSTIVPFSVHRGGMRLEKEILRIFERN